MSGIGRCWSGWVCPAHSFQRWVWRANALAVCAGCGPESPADRIRVSGQVEATEVQVAAPVGGRLVSGLVPWLNDHASKLAEPLGELEEVEIIEIRRPGETDDAAENQD